MKRLFLSLTILAFLCFTIACQQGKEAATTSKADIQADTQTIKDIVADFNVALNTGDIDKASFHMADEVKVIPPNRPLLDGKADCTRDLQQLFDQFTFKEVDVVKDVQIGDDLAVTYYTWTCETTPKAGGEPTNDKGNGILVLRKQPDGIWKFIYLIYSNESLVSPEEPAVFSSPATLGTTDPIIGTWKEKSVNDPNIKEAFIIYKETDGGMIDFSTKNVLKDGTTDSSKWLIPKEGGIVKCLSRELEKGLQYVAVFPDSNHLIISIMKDGRQVAMYNKIISKDGKELTQKLTGTDREGKPLNDVKVYEKQ